MELAYDEASAGTNTAEISLSTIRNVTTVAGIDFRHQEDPFDDFAREPLLPHKYSGLGPALAVADVNGDGLDDFFIGNAADRPGRMFIQDKSGHFIISAGPWEEDGRYEDTGALFFDPDQDGDPDLYVVNGGNDPLQPTQFYQDRLYINTPEGFKKSTVSLPALPVSGQEVATGDFDGDGRPDLFIGGRIVPGQYPLAAPSYILLNIGGRDEHLRFADVTQEAAPYLSEAGLVTTALWSDYDQDGLTDLVIAGEWMPVRFLRNTGGAFREQTNTMPGLEDLSGWWYSLAAVDVDQDGDPDYIAGNLGLNYKYRASAKEPFEVFANDFDENQQLDIVLSYQKKGESLPVRGRECSAQQVPALAARFETYEAFAEADLSDLYGKGMLDRSYHLQAKIFASYWLENRGRHGFAPHLLPPLAQLSSINTIQKIDYNGDQYPDLVVFGNLYDAEVETPRNDAGIGLVLTGSADGAFRAVPAKESGLLITGEVRKVVPVRWTAEGKPALLVARKDDALQLLLLPTATAAPTPSRVK